MPFSFVHDWLRDSFKPCLGSLCFPHTLHTRHNALHEFLELALQPADNSMVYGCCAANTYIKACNIASGLAMATLRYHAELQMCAQLMRSHAKRIRRLSVRGLHTHAGQSVRKIPITHTHTHFSPRKLTPDLAAATSTTLQHSVHHRFNTDTRSNTCNSSNRNRAIAEVVGTLAHRSQERARHLISGRAVPETTWTCLAGGMRATGLEASNRRSRQRSRPGLLDTLR